MGGSRSVRKRRAIPDCSLLTVHCSLILVAHTGLEPVISALRGQRVNQLHQCAASDLDYSGELFDPASWLYSDSLGVMTKVGTLNLGPQSMQSPNVSAVTFHYSRGVIYSAFAIRSS
jgi:hypothetical protein